MEELRTRLDHHIDRAVLPMHREPTNDGQIFIIIIQTMLSICVNQKVNKDKRVVTVLKKLTFKFSRVIFGVILILSIFVTRSSNLQLPHPCTILHLLVPGREKSQKFQEVETDTMHKSGMVRARGDFFLPNLAGFVYKVN